MVAEASTKVHPCIASIPHGHGAEYPSTLNLMVRQTMNHVPSQTVISYIVLHRHGTIISTLRCREYRLISHWSALKTNIISNFDENTLPPLPHTSVVSCSPTTTTSMDYHSICIQERPMTRTTVLLGSNIASLKTGAMDSNGHEMTRGGRTLRNWLNWKQRVHLRSMAISRLCN